MAEFRLRLPLHVRRHRGFPRSRNPYEIRRRTPSDINGIRGPIDFRAGDSISRLFEADGNIPGFRIVIFPMVRRKAQAELCKNFEKICFCWPPGLSILFPDRHPSSRPIRPCLRFRRRYIFEKAPKYRRCCLERSQKRFFRFSLDKQMDPHCANLSSK